MPRARCWSSASHAMLRIRPLQVESPSQECSKACCLPYFVRTVPMIVVLVAIPISRSFLLFGRTVLFDYPINCHCEQPGCRLIPGTRNCREYTRGQKYTCPTIPVNRKFSDLRA